MKKIAYLLSVGALFSLITFFGCGDDNGTDFDPVQERIDQLSGNWTIDGDVENSVVFNTNVDRSLDYDGFVLNFGGNQSYTATFPVAIQPGPFDEFRSGNYLFVEGANGPDLNTIVLDGDLTVIIRTLDDTSLEIRIENYIPAGRLKAVEGQWDFSFSRGN